MMHDHLREIGMIARALDSISNIEFKALGLEKGKYLYIVRIFEHPGIIQERLAELIKVDRTTAARAIKKLEQEGWIERRPDLDNQKIRRLYVTEKGQVLYPLIIREHEYSTSVALSGFDEKESEELLRLLKKVRSNVETDWTEVKKGKHREY